MQDRIWFCSPQNYNKPIILNLFCQASHMFCYHSSECPNYILSGQVRLHGIISFVSLFSVPRRLKHIKDLLMGWLLIPKTICSFEIPKRVTDMSPLQKFFDKSYLPNLYGLLSLSYLPKGPYWLYFYIWIQRVKYFITQVSFPFGYLYIPCIS